MSWQGYIDSSLCGTGIIDKAAIISLAGDSVWAKSSDFDLKPNEMKIISSIAKRESAVVDKLYTDGVYIAGERYSLLAALDDEQPAYCRHADDESNPDIKKIGVVIAKTNQAIIVAHHGSEDNQTRQTATPIVAALAEYLIKQQY